MAGKNSTAYSVLDLSPIVAGSTAAQSFKNSLDIAKHAEEWGYTRYWFAEHHNIAGVGSAATSILIAHVAEHTKRMRVGSGGIMLPNHAPLVIAEQFGTLESLYPGRIDLGLGRAPGGDQLAARALRRGLGSSGDSFPEDLRELMGYFAGEGLVRAVPGNGLKVPVYLLGSSDFSARLAAELGLPFAFASHFAPEYLEMALGLYREGFRASEQLEKPYVMVGVNLFAAESDAEGRRLFTTLQQAFLNLVRGMPRQLAAPVDAIQWSLAEQSQVKKMTRYSVVGGREAVREQLRGIVEATGADEVIFTAQIYDHEARLKAFEIGAEVMKDLH